MHSCGWVSLRAGVYVRVDVTTLAMAVSMIYYQ